jgi:hypothetical protein
VIELKPTPKVSIRILSEHRINFGTAEEPNYKSKDDVVEVDAEQAKKLIAFGYVEQVKGDATDGN